MKMKLKYAAFVTVTTVLVASATRAGIVTPSDILSESLVNSTGTEVPFTPPNITVLIPETAAEEPVFPTFPAREINFLEAGTTAAVISDRLRIGTYQMYVQSDSEANLEHRPAATVIPASALETFQPFRIEAFSDGEGSVQASDTLRITLGWYGPGTGTVIFSGSIPEPSPEGAETSLTTTIPTYWFDVEEPTIETGGVPGKISDYLDILTPIQVTFISSDDPSVYANLPAANASVTENPETGATVIYSLHFQSDAVPEPASIALLAVALLGAQAFQRRRQTR